MSTRANSLRTLLLDGVYFVLSLVAFGVLTTSLVFGADAVADPIADVAKDRRLTDDHIDSQLNTDDNMPSGNPAESAAEKRETRILGMKLFEVRPGLTRVQDVTAASPAWDAGIRRGDQLISIEGQKIRQLAPWVEDIARLLDDREDGKAVSARVVRGDEPLDLRIKLPVSRAAQARDARQEQQALAKTAQKQGQSQPQSASAPVAASGASEHDYLGPGYVGGGGFVGGGYDDGSIAAGTNDDRNADSAIARLSGVNTVRGAGGRPVGLATFQATGSNIAVNVGVRGLPQGSYVVGIDDGGAMVGAGGANPYGAGGYGGVGFDAGYDPNDPTRPNRDEFNRDGSQRNVRGDRNGDGRRNRNDRMMNNQQNQHAIQNINPQTGEPFPGQQPMPGQVPGQGLPNQPMPQQPIGPAGPGAGSATPNSGVGGGTPAGSEGASLADPRGASYLAQQLDPAMQPAATNSVQNPGGAAAADALNRTNENANNRNAATQNQLNRNRNVTGDPTVNPGTGGVGQPGGPQFMRELGVLNVGPDGVGNLQTRLDGIQIRSLVGLSVTVASTASAGGNSVGPNGKNPLPNARPGNNNAAAARNQQFGNGPGVVATGVIQLTQGGVGVGTGNEEPNYNAPLDPVTERARDRNFDASDPRQDFDPSSPRQDFDASNPRQDFDPSQESTNPQSRDFDPASQPGAANQDFNPAQ